MLHQSSAFATPGFSGPLYAQVASYLRERITSSTWSPMAPLPNEAALAKDIGVSVGTVRKALEILEEERLIQRRQGRGTFIVDAGDETENDRFVSLTVAGRKLKGDVTSLKSEITTADAEAANHLGIRSGSRVISIDLAWRASYGVRAVERIVVSQARFPNLESALAAPIPFLFPIYRRKYKTVVQSINERAVCLAADASLCRVLGVGEGQPLLRVERFARTRTRECIEWSVRTMCLGSASYATVSI